MFITKFSKANCITFLSIIFGIIAIYFSVSYDFMVDEKYFKYALICLMCAGICDMFDGKVARACKRTEEDINFGIQLDSMADTVNFLCVPVVIMLSLGMNNIVDILAFITLIVCGISRLCYFNIIASKETVKYYTGLPVTTTAIFFPLIGLLYGIIDSNTLTTIYLIMTFLIAFLFVFKIRIQKLKGVAYIIVPVLALALLWLLLAL